MKRLVGAIAILGSLGYGAIACSSAAPTTPTHPVAAAMKTDPNGQTCKTLTVIGNDAGYCPGDTPFIVSHADQLACRTVYRLLQLAQIGPDAISDQQAANALDQSAVGTTKSFDASLIATADEIGLVGNTPTILAPLVSQCTAMGITAKNAEQVS